MSKILIVDDEEHYVSILVDVLADIGHEVKGCSDPQLALPLIKEFKPELLISDIMMPQMNGYELTRKARELEPNLIVVLMSGNVELSREDLNLHGASNFFQKPFPMARFRESLSQLLSQSK